MIKFLATLNPLTLRLARSAAQSLFTAMRWKLVLTAALATAAALVALAGIYTLTAPLDTARQLAASLRGGPPKMPAQRAHCVPDSPAVVDGHFTAQARQAVSDIPPDVTITPATAYLLYRWSHQGQRWQPTWDDWNSYLRDHLIRPTASDLEIAESVDPKTDYTPYIVAARSTTIDLSIGGPVVADRKQIEALADQIYRDCRTRGRQEGRHQTAQSKIT
jgi:hypothetical protein